AAWKKAAPSHIFQEIPLDGLGVWLQVKAKDPATGGNVPIVFPGILAKSAGGTAPVGGVAATETWVATFDNIVGDRVILLYESLAAGGTPATLALSATYLLSRRFPLLPPRLPPPELGFVFVLSDWVSVPMAFQSSVALDRKFAAYCYQLKYDMTVAGTTRPILGVEDLRSFDIKQTEFTELRLFGDLSDRYQSIRNLFLGVLSHTIVVIPFRYVILREKETCAAACHALLDSSPGLNAG